MKSILKLTALTIALIVNSPITVSAQTISAKTTLSISIRGVSSAEQGRITGPYVVSPSGQIFLPMLKYGIQASGMSSSALARSIENAYRSAEIYKNPRITVISQTDQASANLDAQIVTVGGNVKSPGPKPFTRNMTLFEVISAAGGADAFGSLKRVELFRNGKRHVYDLRDLAAKKLKVYPGDSINVPQKTVFGN